MLLHPRWSGGTGAFFLSAVFFGFSLESAVSVGTGDLVVGCVNTNQTCYDGSGASLESTGKSALCLLAVNHRYLVKRQLGRRLEPAANSTVSSSASTAAPAANHNSGQQQSYVPNNFYGDATTSKPASGKAGGAGVSKSAAPAKGSPTTAKPASGKVYGAGVSKSAAPSTGSPTQTAAASPMVKPLPVLSKAGAQEQRSERAAAAKDCLLSEWGDWSACEEFESDGMRSRTMARMKETVNPQLPGGKPCPPIIMREHCIGLWRPPEALTTAKELMTPSQSATVGNATGNVTAR